MQAEQEHALAEGRKHAAAAQAQLSAELDSARARLAAAAEKLDQQQRSFTAGAQEERRAAQSKEALLQASAFHSLAKLVTAPTSQVPHNAAVRLDVT